MKHAAALRISILAAMGIVPLACGETDEGSSAPTAGRGGSDMTEAGGPGDAGYGPVSAGQGGGSSSGGAGGAASSAGAAGAPITGGAAPTITLGCTSPEVLPDSGIVYCKDQGYYTRPQAVACSDSGEGGAGGGAAQLPRADFDTECADDADCAEFERGYCSSSLSGDPFNHGSGEVGPPTCRSGCTTDDDCGDRALCVCNGGMGICVSSQCRQDADCGEGYACATIDLGCGTALFLCQSSADECSNDADCEPGTGPCSYDEPQEGLGMRVCGGAVCGRPFFVANAARLPPVETRTDWQERAAPSVEHLSFEERLSQAQHWTKLGQMEHASIAAFARFSLQLLALGAPADLVEACTAALADETAHAKLCFGIASAYAGRAIGPGPLDVSNSLELTSLSDIVDLVIAEGCIGETSAALEALEAAESAADPVIRAAYTRIATDEQRHAELAFRFVRWALDKDGATVAQRLTTALAALPEGRGVREVVEPCLLALRDERRVA